MRRCFSALSFSVITIAVGTIVMFGWIFDIAVLKSILPFWVTMKFSTALCFCLSGLTLYCLQLVLRENTAMAQIVLTISTLSMLLLMGTMLISTFLGIKSGVEDLFVKEEFGAVKSSMPGRPSVGTMVNFIILVFVGVLQLFHPELNSVKRKHQVAGAVVVLFGLLAIIGYIVNVPFLYYAVDGISSAMAFHTAMLFVFLGIGLLRLEYDMISK